MKTVFSIALALGALLVVAAPRITQAEVDCLGCHGDKSLQDASGHSVGVEAHTFAASLHGSLQCTACHTEFPVLNQFGRQFKLSGYTAAADTPFNFLPLAVMLQPSFTNTQKAQQGGAAPGFGDNNNGALTQASISVSLRPAPTSASSS